MAVKGLKPDINTETNTLVTADQILNISFATTTLPESLVIVYNFYRSKIHRPQSEKLGKKQGNDISR